MTTSLKSRLGLIGLCAAFLAAQAGAGDDLLFHCTFDGSPEPAIAAGAKTFRTNATSEFQQGVSGQAIVIGGQSPEGRTRFVSYAPAGNLNPETGTVSLWVKPLDWDGDDGPFIMLFNARMGDAEMFLYRFHGSDEFRFYIGPIGGWDRLYKEIAHWKKGQWHHVAGTWTANEFALFLDGQLIGIKKRDDRPVSLLPVKALNVGLEQVNEPGDLKRRSLVDELRIYGRALAPAEIAALYGQYAEAAAIRDARHLITLGEKTAIPDGQMNPGEYAFTGSGFVDLEGFVAGQQSQYALSYDRTNVYVALCGPAPAATPLPARELADRLEVYLSPAPSSNAGYRFVFTPDNQVRADAPGKTAWTCDGLSHAASVTNGRWTVEAAIPFAALGLTAAPDGQSWRINLGRVFATPPGTISAFPAKARLDDVTGFGEVRFDRQAPSIRVDELFAASVTGQIAAVSAEGRRLEGALSGWSSVTDYSQRILNFTLQDGARQTPFDVRGRDGFPSLYGDITLDIFDGKSKETLFRGVYSTRSVMPLFGYFAYAIPEKNLLMTGLRCQGATQLRLRFLGSTNTVPEQHNATNAYRGYPQFPRCTRTVYEQIKAVPSGTLHFNMAFDVDYAAIGPGYYLVNVDALDETGKVLGSFDRKFNIPGKDSPVTRPFTQDNDRVPYPWAPIKAGNATADVWGRTYDFGGGFLFSSLVSQNKELLAAPASLRLNGQELSVVGAPVLRKVSSDDWSVVWSKDAHLGRLDVKSRIRTHFDGYCAVELTLQPTGAVMEIKTLSLDVPVKSEFATLVTDGRVPPYTKTGALSNGWFQTGQRQIWVGNEAIGFNWMVEALEGWSLKADSKNVEVLRQGDTTVIRFNLVDVPLDLTQPLTLTFGFVVTPSRPLEPGMRRIRSWRETRVVAQGGADYFGSFIYNTEPWEYEAGAFTDAMLYTSYGFYSPFAPEFGYWETKWRLPPFGMYSGVMPMSVEGRERCLYADTGDKLFTNFILNQFQDFIKYHYPPHPHVKHFMFDVGGGVGARYQALAMYKMIKEKNPDAKVLYHTGYGRDMAGQHFAEASISGEGFEPNVAKQLNYYDLLTPEFYRAVYLKEIWGLRGWIICQLTRGLSLFNPGAYAKYDINAPVHRSAMLHFMGYMMTHDVDAGWEDPKKMMPMVNRLYDAQDRLGWDDQVVFHPYWKPDSGVRQVAPGLSRVMASAYSRNGKMLLAVLNDTDKEQNVTLELDLAKLGVKAGLKGHDVWQPEATYTLSGRWEARVPPRGFRLILWEAE